VIKNGSKQTFVSCPFPHALGKEMATQKQEKKKKGATTT
jgi:hypothetical protein